MYAPVRQNTFCKAADILADKCGCDVIARIETDGDAVEVGNLIKLQKGIQMSVTYLNIFFYNCAHN
ncbi:hypothetical protein DWV75_11320 [Ruminococcus sp. AF12-5]|nr:hypothetical protein DWV75_11320 [Ruminococcus sp. AF12-5]